MEFLQVAWGPPKSVTAAFSPLRLPSAAPSNRLQPFPMSLAPLQGRRGPERGWVAGGGCISCTFCHLHLDSICDLASSTVVLPSHVAMALMGVG